MRFHELMSYNLDGKNYERVDRFLRKNNSYIGEADVKFRNTNNGTHYTLSHYDSSTVLLYLRETDFVIDVYSDKQEKAKEVFGKLESIALGKDKK